MLKRSNIDLFQLILLPNYQRCQNPCKTPNHNQPLSAFISLYASIGVFFSHFISPSVLSAMSLLQRFLITSSPGGPTVSDGSPHHWGHRPKHMTVSIIHSDLKLELQIAAVEL